MMISRCPNCGTQTQEDARVCGACGWDFAARKIADPSHPSAKPLRAPTRRRSALAIAVVTAAAIGLVSIMAIALVMRSAREEAPHPARGSVPFVVRSTAAAASVYFAR